MDFQVRAINMSTVPAAAVSANLKILINSLYCFVNLTVLDRAHTNTAFDAYARVRQCDLLSLLLCVLC